MKMLPLTLFCSALGLMAQARADYVLEKVVEVSRHGVRPPTAGDRRGIEAATERQWSRWSSADGQLTAHGASAMRLKGAYEGQRYRQLGLLGSGCPDGQQLYIWASPLQRTRDSAAAFASGAFPGCKVAVHSSSEDNDPLFQNNGPGGISFAREPQQAEALQALGGSVEQAQRRYQPQIALLKQALCQPGSGCPQFDQPWRIRFAADGRIMINGLDTLAAMAESLRMAWSEGQPPAEVAFGHARDSAQLGRLMPLLTLKYDATNDLPYVAQRGASLLMQQIAHALQQGISPQQDGPPAARWLLYVAHDMNIAWLRTLLGFSWTQGHYPRGNIPPGGSLLFERWRAEPGGQRYIRILFRSQSLDQIRYLTPLSASQPLLESEMTFKGCAVTRVGTLCPYQATLQRMQQHILPELTAPVSYPQ